MLAAEQPPQQEEESVTLVNPFMPPSNHFGLTDLVPDCMHRVMEFLNIKEGIALRGICRHFCVRESGGAEGEPPSKNLDISLLFLVHVYESTTQ